MLCTLNPHSSLVGGGNAPKKVVANHQSNQKKKKNLAGQSFVFSSQLS